MPDTFRTHIRSLLMDTSLGDLRRYAKARVEIWKWQKASSPVPVPHAVKQTILLTYAAAFGIDTLIETGTLFGDMVYAMKDRFRTIQSIELSSELCDRAKHRFRNSSHIQVIHGNSADILPPVLSSLRTQALFWLDGHYSGGSTAKGTAETPVRTEVTALLQHNVHDHVILIDDARYFDGAHDYPTLHEMQALVALNKPTYTFSVRNDVIRIHPHVTVPSPF